MKSLIVGNWKMNLNNRQAETLVQRLDMHITTTSDVDIVLCPSFVALPKVKELLGTFKDKKKFALGAQNVNEQDEGPLTGEVSAPMLKGMAKYVIVGHSERRVHFGETDETIARKVAACMRHNLDPILCVGENIMQRREGLAARTVLDQLEVDLSEITPSEVTKVTLAYEPVWAIGTGEFANPIEVQEMFRHIRLFMQNRYKSVDPQDIRILYGGSVNDSNFKSYLNLPEVDGLLVGGASLNYKAFSKICQPS